MQQNNTQLVLPVEVDSNLMTPEAFEKLSELSTELNKAYNIRQIFRTETEARVSVLDNIRFPTKASKYWQCIREQTVMLEQLALLSFEFRRNENQIRRLQSKIDTPSSEDDSFKIEDYNIDLEECLFKRTNMKTVAEDRVREIQMWSMLKAEQVQAEVFDTENVNTHQLVSYTTQFALMLGTASKDKMTSGEIINIVGQFQTAYQRCKTLNVEQEVLKNLSPVLVQNLQPLLIK